MVSSPNPNKNILRNFLSVGFIQAAGLALPLLTIPYLLKVLGAEGFGTISLALAFTTLFVVLTDYGYNFIGTRQIARLKNDPEAVNKVFSTMLSAQGWLTIGGFLIFVIRVFLVPDFYEHHMVFMATFGIVIGSTLLPTWFFQGMEKFTTLHWIIFASRALYTAMVFVLVQDKNDLLWIPVLNSSTTIAAGVFGLLLLLFRYNLQFTFSPFKEVLQSLKEGFNLFVSAISTTSIQQLPIIVLGLFTTETIVGYYSFADKIILVFRLATQVLSTVVFPKAVLISQQSFTEIRKFLLRIEKWSVPLLFIASLFLYFLPEILQLTAPQYVNHVVRRLLKIMALLPPVYMLKLTTEQMLIAFDLTALYRKIMLISLLVNIVMLILLTWQFNYSGTAIAVVLTEVIIFLAMRRKWKIAEQTSTLAG